MRDIYKKYQEADKVPEKVYSELHTDFLVPLDIKIDDAAEEQFKLCSEAFYIWGDNRPELITRKGMALVNLDGEITAKDLSIGPLDHHNRKYDKGLVDECYLESHFTQHTPMLQGVLEPIRQFDLCRSSILWWQDGDNFVPHTDVVLPTVNLRLWGATNRNVSLRYGPDRDNLIEADYEPNRLYLIDTSILHDARAFGDVYQYFIALLPTEKNYKKVFTLSEKYDIILI